jgi:methyl halide transferase
MEETKEMQCCVTECERPLDKTYWDNQYKTNTTGWDLGKVSPPIKQYVDGISNKNIAILIPGCGNSYEAEYLLQQGFTNITIIDIAPTLVGTLKTKYQHNKNIKIVLGDFFEHQGNYDLIVEQTFFCALPPTLRQQYVFKMHQLLNTNGLLVGLLFNRNFEVSPPFGGSKAEYELLFKDAFQLVQIETATNSIDARANTELFIVFEKNSNVFVNLYNFEGITCSGCVATVSEKYYAINEDVLNVSVSTNFSEILLVSKKEIALEFLQGAIAYDAKYKIQKK